MHSRNRLIVLCALFTILASNVFSQPSFKKHTVENNLPGAYWVYAKDIDDDDHIDLVTASFNGIEWWENNGSQSFSKHFLGSLQGAWGAFADDIDGDGDVDILGCSPAVDITMLYKNDGSEDFKEIVVDARGLDPERVVTGDLDGDGKKDIVAPLWESGQFVWYENRGSEFRKHNIDSNISGPHSVAVADIDGDGNLDVVGASAGKTSWYENDGDGNFKEHAIDSNGGLSVNTADIDGDGDIDIIRQQRDNGDIDWLENDDDGDFTEHNIHQDYDQCWAAVAGDIDGDGDLDIATAGFSHNNILIWLNQGGGQFGDSIVVDNVDTPRAVHIEDLDGDGDGDLVVAIRDERDLVWYEVEGEATPGEITVTAPNGGEQLSPGEDFKVTWHASAGFSKVRIDFSTDGGSTWSKETAGTDNDGRYTWTVPDAPSQTCLIRIQDAAHGEPSDISDDVFTIVSGGAPEITSFSPLQGAVGTMVTIHGANFQEVDVVRFNGAQASFQIESETEITAVAPANAISGKISVASEGGDAESADEFTVLSSGGSQTSTTFEPAEDTRVKKTRPGKNYGSDSRLDVESATFESYLKFEVAGLSGNVTRAVIRMLVDNASDNSGTIYPASNNYSDTSQPWEEGELTFDNRPELIGDALDSPGEAREGEYIEFDVTAAILGNGIYSFGLQNESRDKVEYFSKESNTPPQLIVDASGSSDPIMYDLVTGVQGIGEISISPSGGKYDAGTVVELLATPASNWQFDGWVGDLTGNDNPNSITMDDDKFVSAVFTEVSVPTYRLTTSIQGSGDVVLTPSGGVYDQGTVVELIAAPASGWQFAGWSDDLAGNDNPATITMNGDKHVAAIFSESTGSQLLTFRPAHDGQVKLSDLGANYGDKSTTKVEKNKFTSYFKFDVSGLSGPAQSASFRLYVSGASDDGGRLYTVSNDFKDSATAWTEDKLTAGNAPSITGSPVAALGPVQSGSVVEIDLTSVITGNGTFSFALRGESTDQAKYHTREGDVPPELIVQTTGGETQEYTIQTSVQGSGQIELDPPGGVYREGAPVTLTAVPEVGWQFSGWSGHIAGTDNPVSIIVNSDKQVTAVFDEISVTQYTLTVSTQGQGQVTLDPAGGLYPEDTVVQLQAQPSDGWLFAGWSGDVSGDNSLASLTMNQNKNVTAAFVEQVSSGETTLVFNPVDDAKVKSTSPTRNYGNDSELRVRHGSPMYTSYLKFDIQGVQSQVTSAVLRLYVVDEGDDGGEVYSVSNDYKGRATAWDEDGIVWDNAPAIDGNPLDRAGEAQKKEWLELDVTPAVTGNGVISFGLMNNSSNSVMYSTREGDHAPELILVTGSGSGNTPPVALDDETITTSDATEVAIDVLANDFDADSDLDASSVTIVSAPENGSVTLEPQTGLVTYVPESDFTREDTFNYIVADENGATSDEATVTVIVRSSDAKPRTLTLEPVDDNQVKLTDAGKNYEDKDAMKSERGKFVSYLKFELSGLAENAESAFLRLYCSGRSEDGGSVYLVSNNFVESTTPWHEESITAGNAPAIQGTAVAAFGEVESGTFVEVDVTAAVSGNGIYSFAIKNDSPDQAQYHTKEGANPPQLIVTAVTNEAFSKSDDETVLAFSHGDASAGLPDRVVLSQNYPNPFNAGTTIEYGLPERAHVTVAIYNILGQTIKTLVDGAQEAGFKRVRWHGRNEAGHAVSSGIYFVKMNVGDNRHIRRLILQK